MDKKSPLVLLVGFLRSEICELRTDRPDLYEYVMSHQAPDAKDLLATAGSLDAVVISTRMAEDMATSDHGRVTFDELLRLAESTELPTAVVGDISPISEILQKYNANQYPKVWVQRQFNNIIDWRSAFRHIQSFLPEHFPDPII